MNKSTLSILMAAMMAASGFAAAQATVTPALPADGTPPPTRAEVKSQIPKEGSAGDKRGVGPQITNPTSKASDNTRADVKAQIKPEGSAGDKRGQGPQIEVPAGGSSENSRAGVKAGINSKGTSGVERGEGPMVDDQTKMTTAERKAKRDERKAIAKAKREAKMNASAIAKPADPMMKDGKAQ